MISVDPSAEPQNTGCWYNGGSGSTPSHFLEKAFWQLENEPRSRQIEQILHITESGRKEARLHFSSGLRVKKQEDQLHFSYPQGKISKRGNLDS